MSGEDLSGSWSGFYSYPNEAQPPVAFNAKLFDSAGSLTGTTTEVDPYDGTRLQAVVDGRRAGRLVAFLKMYDGADEFYDSVHYEGEVSAEADEIAGRWIVPGVWSGSFVMVRSSGARVEELREEAVEYR
jgi:hypothetical protein